MASQPSSPVLLRFGPFEVHLQGGELRNKGVRIRLSGQPLRILLLLLESPGELVTREELRQQIWGDGTFVDFEGGLNAAINKLRRALNDSAEKPRYIETIPGRGYRFVGTLEHAPPSELAPPVARPETKTGTTTYRRQRLLWWAAAAAGVGIVFIAALLVQSRGFSTARSSPIQWQFTQLTLDGEYADSPALSRDGKLLAYSSGKNGVRDLYLKQIAGGQPLRLTLDGAGNAAPDFSPDGSRIVFRSNHGGGGIYEIAAFGGEARLLARDGVDPKYSPDGTKVAFWTGSDVLPTVPGTGTVWVVPSAGGQPLRMGAGLTTARQPIWSPDGRSLLVIGYASNKLSDGSALDWWTISNNGDVAGRAGIRDALLAAGLNPGGDYDAAARVTDTSTLPYPTCWLPDPNRVIFSTRSGDARNIWSAQLSPEGKVAGAVQRLTAGAGNEANGSCVSSDTFVFERKTFARDIWSLPFDLDRARPTGPAVQLTHGPSTVREGPSVSADGRRIAFDMLESGVLNVWVHDVASGRETKLAPSSFTQRYPVITPSGDRIAYSSYENDKRILYIATPGGVPEKLCEGCVRPTDWSRDEKKLLLFKGSPYQVILLDIVSHQQTTLLAHPKYSLVLAHFSPDNRWASFTVRVQPNRAWIMIAPIDGPLPVSEGSWIKVSEDNEAEDAGIWSPDGKTLYFTSSRDGHVCLWGQRIDPNSHQPVGEAFAVQHFHERPVQPLRILFPAAGRIAVSLVEDTSSIWMMSRQPAR
jgi:Tol biopolymer transport system component/DNA-binding winged helix-turn-helix (wHTH) protein